MLEPGLSRNQVPEFGVAFSREGSACVLAVRGELDLTTAPELITHLEAAPSGSAAAVIVDLTAVTFLDSSGMTALVRARRSLDEADMALTLVCDPESRPSRALAVSGLDALFEIRPSLDQALSAVAALTSRDIPGGYGSRA
jgi:anti-anti-sigma factor